MTLILDIWSPKFFCAPPDILSIICEILVNIRSLVSEEFADRHTHTQTYRRAYSINKIDGNMLAGQNADVGFNTTSIIAPRVYIPIESAAPLKDIYHHSCTERIPLTSRWLDYGFKLGNLCLK